MKQPPLSSIALGLLLIAVVCQFLWTFSVVRESNRTALEFSRMKDSLAMLQLTVDSLKAQIPGLGEYMTTIQLHTAKLWFAAEASNWKLAKYELDELAETMEAAELLHARRNNIDISLFLRGVRIAQVPLLEQSLERKSVPAFRDAYRQTLVACNACHRPAGYDFIRIVTPSREPVTNQEWSAPHH
jgi:hypothetical protein